MKKYGKVLQNSYLVNAMNFFVFFVFFLIFDVYVSQMVCPNKHLGSNFINIKLYFQIAIATKPVTSSTLNNFLQS